MPVPIRFKEGCRFKEMTPALGWIFWVLLEICSDGEDLPEELVITSVNDSAHKVGSRHYTNEAVDIRSKNFAGLSDKLKFVSLLRSHLNAHAFDRDKFIVLFESVGTENEHFHVQVKRGEKFFGA